MGIKPIVVLMVGLAFASVHLAAAQQHEKIPKIGWLGARPATPGSGTGIELFLREFHTLGYVEAKI
jgi:hypothetical protein